MSLANPIIHKEVLSALRTKKAFLMQGLFLLVLAGLVWLLWPVYFIGLAVYLVLLAAVVTGYVVWRDARVGPGDKLISVIRARGFMLRGKGVKVDILHHVPCE